MFLKAAREFKFQCQNQFLSFHRTVKSFHSQITYLSTKPWHLSQWNCLPLIFFFLISLLTCFEECCIIISSITRYCLCFLNLILIHFAHINSQMKASNVVIKIRPHMHLGINFLLLSTPCAAAAKSLQSCPTLCDPTDGSPPGSPILGTLQARTLEWVSISFSNAGKWKVRVKSLSHVQLLATPWTAAHQALHPWDFPGKSTGVGCHCRVQNKVWPWKVYQQQNTWWQECYPYGHKCILG